MKEDKLAAQVLTLSDLIDYQKGSVVSRTLVDKKTGTVTLFAFDGQISPETLRVLLFGGDAHSVVGLVPKTR